MYAGASRSGIVERRQQKDRSNETRALLVRATVSLLQSEGYAGTTTALIARQAGVTTGALHHHYAGKDDLMIGVLDAATDRLRTLLDRYEIPAPGEIDARRLVDHLWQAYGDPAYWAVWEIIIGTRANGDLHQRVVTHRRDTIRSVVSPWIERCIGPAAARPEATTLFAFMLIAIRGLGLERFLHRDPAYFETHLGLLADLVGPRLATLADAGERPPDLAGRDRERTEP